VVVDLDPVIAALVQSENPLLRKGGVVSFRSLRAPAPELVRRALGDADFRVRLQLLEWLRAAPPWVDRELYGDCLRALARDPQFEIRQKMTSYLSEIARRNQLLAGEIADVLTRDEAQEIRAGAFEYLGNVRALESQRELLERGLADVHPPIRLLCAQRFQKALRSADIPVLLAFLRDLNEERRRNAAELLWRFPPEELVSSAEALEQLWYALEDTQDTPRALASRALARVLKREELPRLLPQLQDQSSRIRGFVFEAVLRLDAIEALPAIVAALPLLASVVDPRGGESKLSHLDLLRWLIEKNHRMELEQVLAHVSKLTLSNSVVELLDAALDAEQKSALLEAAALGEDRKRAADALYALRRFGRGNPEFLRTCLELRAGTVDQESRARLTSILCEEGGLESFDAILEELSNPQFSNSGGSIPSAARYFARWTDEVRRPRLEEALRASPGQWAWFTQGKPVEQATFAYLQAVANAEPSSSGGVYAHLVALAKHTDPDGAALVLAQLRGPRVSPSTSVGELVARGTTSSEQASLFVSRHVLALRLGRPADFASYTREILGEERYADDARHSAVLLCALLPDGSGDAVILESLEHANGTVRAAAARAAAHLLLAGAIPRLKELLRDHEASFEANHALLRFAAFGYPIR
jgi:HEAT repeat protein